MSSPRRIINLREIVETERVAALSDFARLYQKKLEQKFPANQGFQHACAWSLASCVDKQKASQEIMKSCKTALLTVSNGPMRGISITVEPQDTQLKSLKVVVNQAIPRVVKTQDWILTGAMGAGLLAGVPSLLVSFFQTWRLRQAMLVGTAIGIAVALCVAFLGLLLLLPVRLVAKNKMKQDIETASNLIDEICRELQPRSHQFPEPVPVHSSVLKFFIGLLVSSGITAGCYWSAFHLKMAEGLQITLIVLACITAVGVFGALIGFIVSMF